MLRVFSTPSGLVIADGEKYFSLTSSVTLDEIFQSGDPAALLRKALGGARPSTSPT